MKINGYEIREAIRRQELRREAYEKTFSRSLYKFESDEVPLPQEAMKQIVECEDAIAKLQAHQSRYNLIIETTINGKTLTLCEAIKRIGGAGRAEKMWRDYATEKNRSRYGYTDIPDVKRQGEEHSKRALSISSTTKLATEAAEYAGALRSAIAFGNSIQIEMEIDQKLLS